ncbi:ABC transporter ATP-binding protein [Azorhizobium caulinodans ORS 571]|uniref:ABC transporter ATP-binding protein n=2 Tax=Azorhizobium caulinodans TaxID=7 RepID=A8IMN0_AZOC5|nr:thiol reductant ABC exporter subunit CydD [Azorhizobium caulinodans]BAF86580.1 ABC transporter ATP-binding protein [Azorhizobium caulinodans ORS 571]
MSIQFPAPHSRFVDGSVAEGTSARPRMDTAGAHAAPARRRRPRPAQNLESRGGALLQLVASLLFIGQAALIARAVGTMSSAITVPALLGPAAGILALGVVRAILEALGARLCHRQARAALGRLRSEVAAAVAARSPLDRNRPVAGAVASALAEQAEAVVPYLSRFKPARLRASVVPFVMLAVVLPLSWAAALVMLVALPLIPVFMALIGWRAQAASEAHLKEMGSMNGFLLDRLRGLATIRALGAVDTTALRLRASAETLKDRTMAVLRIAFLSSAVLELFSALGVAMVAVYVGFHLLGTLEFGTWGVPLNLSDGLFILILAPAFFEPMRDLSAVWHDRAAGEAAFAALKLLTANGLPLPGANMAHPVPAAAAPAPDVVFDTVSFTHAEGRAPFAAFSLTVPAGGRVALLGPSGAGKSTLLALAAGLAPVHTGSVRIGGLPLTAETAAELRSGMAWIGQRPHFFAGSLAANVQMGRPDIGPEAVEEALAFATLDRAVRGRSADDGLGEGGAGLSGGELVRLAIARAAVDPRVQLVLADEPTAHLDAATAAEVTEALLTLATGRTLIVATHDPVLAARLDTVVQLEPRP